jgi:hypothetical protein
MDGKLEGKIEDAENREEGKKIGKKKKGKKGKEWFMTWQEWIYIRGGHINHTQIGVGMVWFKTKTA